MTLELKPAPSKNGFSEDQQQYLSGFILGSDVARKVRGLPVMTDSGAANAPGVSVTLGNAEAAPTGPDAMAFEAQSRVLAAGGKLSKEEQAKREKHNGMDLWDEMLAAATDARWPKGTDLFLWKFHGLFHVAPAQDAFMCRLRIPGGELSSWQLNGLAELSERFAGGYADCTTRANLQFREVGPADGVDLLMGLFDLGIIPRGSGGDNIRNVTASPTSGFDGQELIETLPLARKLHYHIQHHREMYGLPRKFNISFDGGGKIAALADTNDVGFMACRVTDEHATDDTPAGVYFRLELGGITGHKDFARDTGILLKPEECVPVATAIVHAFIKSGDRTDRAKARLKYVLDDWGFDKFLSEVEKEMGGKTLRRFDLSKTEARGPVNKTGHVGVHDQPDGNQYVGVVCPVGRIQADQLRAIAATAQRYGNGTVRLTVWQNLIIPHVPPEHVDSVKTALIAAGLHWDASHLRGGTIACTGAAGCKYAAADTKKHALQIVDHLEETLELDVPVNLHVTGCKNSCAQHYIGDIGLIGTKVTDPDNSDPDADLVEAYDVFVGGGYGEEQGIGEMIAPGVPATRAPAMVEKIIRNYLDGRTGIEQSFVDFYRKVDLDAVRKAVA